MMNAIGNVINQIDSLVWGWWMIILLLGTHIFMTIRTGVIQRKIGTAIRLSVTKDHDAEGEVSQFGALTTALASTIGTGNIIGVGTAIALGGPGAVLWCWLTGVFGIATKYSESLIAVKYRVKTKDGRMQGGAMYALERGLNMRWLGLIFAFFGHQLKDRTKEFILNPMDDENLPEKADKEIELADGSKWVYPESQGVVSLQTTRDTGYQSYIMVQNELTRAFNEVRDEVAMRKFGSKFADLPEENRNAVSKAVPLKISEAEPRNIKK